MAPALLFRTNRRRPIGSGAPLHEGIRADEVPVDEPADGTSRASSGPVAANRHCCRSRCRRPTCLSRVRRPASRRLRARPVRSRTATPAAGPNTTDEFAGFVGQIRSSWTKRAGIPPLCRCRSRVYLASTTTRRRAKRRLDEFFGSRTLQIQRNPDFVADSLRVGAARPVWRRASPARAPSVATRSSRTRCGTSRSRWKRAASEVIPARAFPLVGAPSGATARPWISTSSSTRARSRRNGGTGPAGPSVSGCTASGSPACWIPGPVANLAVRLAQSTTRIRLGPHCGEPVRTPIR